MSVEIRAYDNEHGDPVVVMVTTGSYDVSRLVGLMAEKGRCEDHDRAHLLLRAVRRHNGGRLALKLLRDHGGTDFTEPEGISPETRHRWVPTEPIPEGWRTGNQCFVDDYLDVFCFDPAVPYDDRKPDGSTDRWIKHRRVSERRFVTEWEDAPPASDLHASVSPEQTPTPAADSAQRGDYVTDGDSA